MNAIFVPVIQRYQDYCRKSLIDTVSVSWGIQVSALSDQVAFLFSCQTQGENAPNPKEREVRDIFTRLFF